MPDSAESASLDRWIDRFDGHLKNERRLSEHTRKNYLRDLQFAQAFCRHEQISDWAAVTPALVRRFAAELHRKGQSGRSIQRRLSALRTFFRYLIRESEITSNPAQDIAAPKSPQHLPDVLSADRMQQLLECNTDDPLLQRDLAMFELMYSSGLRLSELVSLNLDDIDRQLVRVTGKGNRSRTVPVGKIAIAALERWLKVRASFIQSEEHALFLSRRGNRISTRSVQKRLAQWARRQGLNESTHPHILRHSFASHLLESSGELRAVQELLGHANIGTTQVYTHLDFQHLAKVYDNAHPRARRRKKPDQPD